jgi:hypothetical protein
MHGNFGFIIILGIPQFKADRIDNYAVFCILGNLYMKVGIYVL